MKEEICQGDLLKVERINMPVVVVSKNFFNQSGEIIGITDAIQGIFDYVRTKHS